jgi:hypothetical protein
VDSRQCGVMDTYRRGSTNCADQGRSARPGLADAYAGGSHEGSKRDCRAALQRIQEAARCPGLALIRRYALSSAVGGSSGRLRTVIWFRVLLGFGGCAKSPEREGDQDGKAHRDYGTCYGDHLQPVDERFACRVE